MLEVVTPQVATQGAESAVNDCFVTVFVVPLRLITQYSYGQFGDFMVLSGHFFVTGM